MSSITFVDYQTIIPASWLNDVNNMVYNGVVPATTLSPTNLSVSTNASIANITNNVVFTSTGAITLPNGTTAQEPGTPSAGMIRFNSTKTQFEGYNGSAWSSFGIVGGSNTQVQYNSSGALAGSSNLTFDGTTLTVNGLITGSAFSTYLASPPAIGGTTAASGKFTTLTSTSDATLHGLTVGLGGGSVATNTAVGLSALATNSTGSYLIGIGYNALNNPVTGSHSIGIGTSALASLSSGSYNIGIGDYALQANTTASNNTAVGYQAGYAITTANRNTLVGVQAMYQGTTAEANTVIGHSAGNAVTTGSNNTLIGGRSDSGTNNGAGFSLTTGGYNNFFGGNAGGLITTGSKNTIIGNYSGNQSSLDIRTSSNYIVLSDGDGNPRGIFNNNGELLINCTSRQAGGTAAYLQIATPTTTSNGIVIQDTGTTYGTSSDYMVFSNSSGSFAGTIYHSASTAVIYALTSDKRLKTDDGIATDVSYLDKTVVHDFTWTECGTKDRGIFAQDEYENNPRNIQVGKDDLTENGSLKNPWTVNYTGYIPDLIVYCQQLKKQVIDLQTAVTALQAKVVA